MDAAGTRKKRFKVWHIIVAVALVVVLFIAALIFFVFSLTRPVVSAGDAFMSALKSQNYEAAFALTTAQLQSELGAPKRLSGMFAAAQPAEWSWSSRQIRNGSGDVSGRVTYSTGTEGSVSLVLSSEGENWRVSGFRMDPR